MMNIHLSKVNIDEGPMYKPIFDLPRSPKEKELLWQLIEPQKENTSNPEDNEVKAIELKEEGNIYMKKKKYYQALEAYTSSLEISGSADLRKKSSLNLCHTFYKMKQFDKCMEQAEVVRQISNFLCLTIKK